jgi:hypothetical protein
VAYRPIGCRTLRVRRLTGSDWGATRRGGARCLGGGLSAAGGLDVESTMVSATWRPGMGAPFESAWAGSGPIGGLTSFPRSSLTIGSNVPRIAGDAHMLRRPTRPFKIAATSSGVHPTARANAGYDHAAGSSFRSCLIKAFRRCR